MHPKRWGRAKGARALTGLRIALWRLLLALALLGLTAFYLVGGLITLGLASYGSWGPSSFPRGFRALLIVFLGGFTLGPGLALRHWYLSVPLIALTAYSCLQLHRLRRPPPPPDPPRQPHDK